MATSETTMFVRIKPYNPRKGYVLRRVTIEGQRFDEDRWYEVSKDFADRLEKVHQKDHKPESPMAFDVVTRAQADEMDSRRRREAERSASTAQKVVSTRDLPRTRSMRAAAEEEPPRRRAVEKEEPGEEAEGEEPAAEEAEEEFPEGDLAPATKKVDLAADGAAPAPAPAKAARTAAPKTRKRK